MSWAQLGRVERKSRADRKLGDALAPGPSTLSHLCAPALLYPAARAPREAPPTPATVTNFPRGGSCTQGFCPPLPSHHLHPQPRVGEPTNRWLTPPRVSLESESDGIARDVGAGDPPPKDSDVGAAGAAESPGPWQTLQGCSVSRSEGRGWRTGNARLLAPLSSLRRQAGRCGPSFQRPGLPRGGGSRRGWGASSASGRRGEAGPAAPSPALARRCNNFEGIFC